ncbi:MULTISPECIES: hypothetical protein [unclassified Microcoleus]
MKKSGFWALFHYSQEQARCLFHKVDGVLGKGRDYNSQEQARCLFHKE